MSQDLFIPVSQQEQRWQREGKLISAQSSSFRLQGHTFAVFEFLATILEEIHPCTHITSKLQFYTDFSSEDAFTGKRGGTRGEREMRNHVLVVGYAPDEQLIGYKAKVKTQHRLTTPIFFLP